MMRIHVTDPLPPIDDSAIDQPIPGIVAGTAEGRAAVAAWAEESRRADLLHDDDLARRRHRRARRGLVSRLRG